MRFAIDSEASIEQVVPHIRDAALQIRLDALEISQLISATAELVSNAWFHGGGGELLLTKTANHRGIEIRVQDSGPGIDDPTRARKDGWSSRPDSLGLGLGAVGRSVDEFELQTAVGQGTTATIRHYSAPPERLFDTAEQALPDAPSRDSGNACLSRTAQGCEQIMVMITQLPICTATASRLNQLRTRFAHLMTGSLPAFVDELRGILQTPAARVGAVRISADRLEACCDNGIGLALHGSQAGDDPADAFSNNGAPRQLDRKLDADALQRVVIGRDDALAAIRHLPLPLEVAAEDCVEYWLSHMPPVPGNGALQVCRVNAHA